MSAVVPPFLVGYMRHRKDITSNQVEAVKSAEKIMDNIKAKTGRPSVINDDALRKIEEGALLGLNNSSLCLFADISQSAFYNYIKEHPSLKDRIDLLRNNNNILAMRNVRKGLEDTDKKERGIMTRWFLEKTDPDFNSKLSVDVQSSGNLTIEARSEALESFLSRFSADNDEE